MIERPVDKVDAAHEEIKVQGYLVHKKTPTPLGCPGALGMVLP